MGGVKDENKKGDIREEKIDIKEKKVEKMYIKSKRDGMMMKGMKGVQGMKGWMGEGEKD